jgi:IMP cyclohydrolase
MYVGRFLVAAPGMGAYRVSSRSFPNRQVVDRDGTLTVVPTPDAPPTDNPYVSYNCLRRAAPPDDRRVVVLGNGSHVDPVTEKLGLGYPARDALATPLVALDFEKDDYDTPRIAAVVEPDNAVVGVVRRDALVVESVDEPTLVATYERDRPDAYAFPSDESEDDDGREPGPESLAAAAYDLPFDHPVCAAAVRVGSDGVATGFYNGTDRADGEEI